MDIVFFWNIDADDTRICLKPERTKQLLDQVKKITERESIDCMSLDMHASKAGTGRHWTFGITYTNNETD